MKKPVRSSLQNLIISYECALAIGNSLNLSEMLHEVIHTIVHKTNAHHGIIWVKSEEQELQPVASAGISIGDVLAQGEIMDLLDVFNQIQKRQQFVLRHKDDDDFLQYCPVLTGKEESVLIVPVTDVAILHLVYARSEIADEPLANLLAGLSKKLSVAVEACMAHENLIKEMRVRVEAEEELQKKTEQLISSEKELQGLYGESEQARKSLMSILEDVTQKENALRESEEKYRNIIENIQDVFYRADMEGNLVMISLLGAKQLGYDSVEEVMGLNIAKNFYAVPEERDGFLKVLEKTGVVDDYEITLKRKDGTFVPVRASSHIFFDKSGNPLGVEGLLSDLTERKRAEQEIENLQRYNRGLIEVSIDLLVTFDHKGIIMDVNGATIHATGRTREELIGTPFADYFTDPERAYKSAMLAFEVEGVRDCELVMKASDGTEIIVSYNTSIYRDQKGDAVGAFAAARDITERKAVEEELKETTGILQSVMDNATDETIVTTDRMGMILNWNEGARRLLGYEPEEVVGRESVRIFHTEEYLKSGIMDVNVKKLIATEKPLTEELSYVAKDGRTIPVQEIVNPRFDEDGEFIGMVGMARDITERRSAEEEIKKKTKELEGFNKLAVGRELKMIELKKEINALLGKLGEEPGYEIAGES